MPPRPRAGDSEETGRGAIAIASWIFRGDGSRRHCDRELRGDGSRRHRDQKQEIRRRRVAAAPRPRAVYSAGASRGDAAAATGVRGRRTVTDTINLSIYNTPRLKERHRARTASSRVGEAAARASPASTPSKNASDTARAFNTTSSHSVANSDSAVSAPPAATSIRGAPPSSRPDSTAVRMTTLKSAEPSAPM